jgi:hypothetical protein
MVDTSRQAGARGLPGQAAEGFSLPQGLTDADLAAAARLIDEWDWENVYGTGADSSSPTSSVELVAKVYKSLTAAALMNSGKLKTRTPQH